jgi:hypothetical protein
MYHYTIQQVNVPELDMFKYRYIILTTKSHGFMKSSYWGKLMSLSEAHDEGRKIVKQFNEEIEERIQAAHEYQKEWERLYGNPKN